jgi:hypothetical protein
MGNSGGPPPPSQPLPRRPAHLVVARLRRRKSVQALGRQRRGFISRIHLPLPSTRAIPSPSRAAFHRRRRLMSAARSGRLTTGSTVPRPAGTSLPLAEPALRWGRGACAIDGSRGVRVACSQLPPLHGECASTWAFYDWRRSAGGDLRRSPPPPPSEIRAEVGRWRGALSGLEPAQLPSASTVFGEPFTSGVTQLPAVTASLRYDLYGSSSAVGHSCCYW